MPVAERVRQAQHAPHVEVLVRQFRQAVEIAIDALLEQGQHEDAPQLHAGTAQRGIELAVSGVGGGAGRLQEVLLQQGEEAFADLEVAIDVLDALEDGRDIVATAGVDLDVLDGDLVKGGLVVLDDSHGYFRTKIVAKTMKLRESGQNRSIFVPGKRT